jgi:hypothetical protein
MKLPLPPNVRDATEVLQYISQLLINSVRLWQKSGDIATLERVAKFYMECEAVNWNVRKIEKLTWPLGDRIVPTSELTQPEKFKRCETCGCKPCQPWNNAHAQDRREAGYIGSNLTFSYEEHPQGHRVLVYKQWKIHCLADRRHKKIRLYWLVLGPKGSSKELHSLAEAIQNVKEQAAAAKNNS